MKAPHPLPPAGGDSDFSGRWWGACITLAFAALIRAAAPYVRFRMAGKKNRGSPIVTLRVPPELLERVKARVARSLHTSRGEPLTVTAFILKALEDKLDHIERSNRPRSRRPAGAPDVPPPEAGPGPESR